MMSGFFRAPTSPESDKIVSRWLTLHPTVTIVPINSFSISVDHPEAKMVCVWVVDSGGATLNEYLVRQGACPGGTMLWYDTKSSPKNKKDTLPQFGVSQSIYKSFVEKIWAAEKEARQQKRGIWRKGGEAEG